MAKGSQAGAEGGSGKGAIVAVLLVALIGIAGGAGFAVLVPEGSAKSEDVASAAAAPAGDAHGKPQASKPAEPEAPLEVVVLEPIHVSLVGHHKNWLRLDASLVMQRKDKTASAALNAQIVDDFAVYLRTLSLEQIDSASGLQFLRDDLSEIAKFRSKGVARAVVIRTLMVE